MERIPLDPSELRPRENRSLIRACVAEALAAVNDKLYETTAPDIVAKNWPQDRAAAALLQRSAVSPSSTTNTTSLGSVAVLAFLGSLATVSAAAALVGRGSRVDLSGRTSASLPAGSTAAVPLWIEENAGVIPVGQPALTSAVIGPMKTLGLIEVITARLAEVSAENAETIVGALLRQSAARSLDISMFDTTAGSTSRPAGLRYGIGASSASSGSGLAAVLDDIATLLAALTTGGAGLDPVLVAQPARIAKLRGLAPGLGLPTFPSAALATDVLIAVDSAAFVSSIGEPSISTSTESVVHFEDTAPQGIGVSGSPTTPMKSFFQSNLVGIRVLLDATWALRLPGAISWVGSMVW